MPQNFNSQGTPHNVTTDTLCNDYSDLDRINTIIKIQNYIIRLCSSAANTVIYYGKESVHISKRYTHLTREKYMKFRNSLTLKQLIYFDIALYSAAIGIAGGSAWHILDHAINSSNLNLMSAIYNSAVGCMFSTPTGLLLGSFVELVDYLDSKFGQKRGIALERAARKLCEASEERTQAFIEFIKISKQTTPNFFQYKSELGKEIDTLIEQLQDKNITINQDYICPITREVMREPVKADDEHYYEREALQRWYNRGNKTCILNHYKELTNPKKIDIEQNFQQEIVTNLKNQLQESSIYQEKGITNNHLEQLSSGKLFTGRVINSMYCNSHPNLRPL
ncbi:U-box domain-containing protein [Rickettsiales endosymbiont of Stachyamoeba lipophora]|uniref:U-box domain-containing protein n=1 Tax=Rickettsiales endosymbiont of Stachyamoeba lipophora TaxID=2486578 RepID=UPI000F651DCF|nr:U-box domain-containing protein [Rickettsiales endosymbiont of Stachyamoeba lipophora]AZL15815.1 hypothetical protein EF513_04555 [Rickettsiales endosymbiont of Stachyamoeba lipophora]